MSTCNIVSELKRKKMFVFVLKHFCFPFYLYFGQRKTQGLSSWPAGDWGISPWGDVTLLRKWILHKGQEKLSPGNITPNMPRNNFELNTYSVCLSPYFGTKLHPKEHLKEIKGQWVSLSSQMSRSEFFVYSNGSDMKTLHISSLKRDKKHSNLDTWNL